MRVTVTIVVSGSTGSCFIVSALLVVVVVVSGWCTVVVLVVVVSKLVCAGAVCVVTMICDVGVMLFGFTVVPSISVSMSATNSMKGMVNYHNPNAWFEFWKNDEIQAF